MPKHVAVTLAGIVAALFLAVALRNAVARTPGQGPLYDPIDFVAFRCAGTVAAHGADPYRAEPLRTCERDAYRESHVTMFPNLVVPAPLPPYALAVFEPLGLVPFRIACVLWFALACASYAGTCAVLIRLTRLAPVVVCAALVLADFYASVLIGQIVPLVVFAACASAAALRSGRVRVASAAALVTMLEPHLGLPLCIGLALAEPRSRRPLVAGAAALGALTFAGGGLARTLEYFGTVLPAQARAEGLSFGAQYSLSALLAFAGVPAAHALLLGSISYAAMLAAGLAIGGAAARATGEPAFALFVPFAAVLVGGPYVHIHQMAAALPLGLVLLGRARGARRILLACAVSALAIPWESLLELAPVVALVFPHVVGHNADPTHVLDAFAGRDVLANDVWGAWAAAHVNDARTPLDALLFKLPTWSGLVVVVAAAAASARPRARNQRVALFRASARP